MILGSNIQVAGWPELPINLSCLIQWREEPRVGIPPPPLILSQRSLPSSLLEQFPLGEQEQGPAQWPLPGTFSYIRNRGSLPGDPLIKARWEQGWGRKRGSQAFTITPLSTHALHREPLP